MKDKNYSLIDTIVNEKLIITERLDLLKQIERKLKKGIGRFKIEIQFDENIDYFKELKFELNYDSKVRYIFNDKIVCIYEISCID